MMLRASFFVVVISLFLLMQTIVVFANGKIVLESSEKILNNTNRRVAYNIVLSKQFILASRWLGVSCTYRPNSSRKSFFADLYLNSKLVANFGDQNGASWASSIAFPNSISNQYFKNGKNSILLVFDKSSAANFDLLSLTFFSLDSDNEFYNIMDPNYLQNLLGNDVEVYDGIIHCHSNFSDGSYSYVDRINQFKELNYDFLIETDHYDQIGSEAKDPAKFFGWAINPRHRNVGFDWYRYISFANTNEKFVVISGAEIETFWNPELDTTDRSHTIAMGNIYQDDLIDSLQKQYDTQSSLIEAIHARGWLAIAAHPDLIDNPYLPWERSRFRYDSTTEDAYDGLDGIEIFYLAKADQLAKTFSWYMDCMAKHKTVLALSGCDSHGWKDSYDEFRLNETTGVFSEKLTNRYLLKSFADGRTYASSDGSKILAINYIPSFSHDYWPLFPTVVLNCKFSFSGEYAEIYCDGELLPQSRNLISDTGFCSIEFEPKSGQHWYNLVVPGKIVTSPIIINGH